ncbi:NERD domain-containing protein [Candidatus Corynebacterium faecigallinarum]|uniref:NERD domain-containing protein n=1 Tax=Candidatus Corynebacterium faecigallinarum TaxID=2838528 RepID=UPI003FCFE4F0
MILSPDLQDIERTAQSDAERKLARLLHAVPNNDAVAFHSIALRTAPGKQMAEADFVILWKGVAIIVEVKGGGVKKYDGTWYTIDRHGDNHRLKSSPIDQARDAMFALRDILKEDGLGWYPSEAIAVTPDIGHPPTDVAWKATHWLAKESMTVDALSSALDAVAQAAPSALRGVPTARIDALRERLFGEFSRLPVIDAQRGAVIDEQNTATSEQAKVLAGLSKNPRILVFGGAGTGKSIVLAEAAKQEAEAGRTVLVTFRSPGLRTFFEPRLSGREIEVREFDAIDPSSKFDVLLVDEAQDLMYPSAMDVLDQVLIGGRGQGRWRMFLDQNNQAHVDGRFDHDVFEIVHAEGIEYDLSKNVRNTRAIVHMVQEYLGADVGDPGIVNGERIQWETVDEGKSRAQAMRIAKSFKKEGIKASDIWIIPATAVESLDEVENGIRVLSPRAAKGLEAEHVIVCELPIEFSDSALAAVYVATTRARVTLHIVCTDTDRRRLQSLVRRAEVTP